MPLPVVEPMPPGFAVRFSAPDDAQEASYFAASARMRSLSRLVCAIVSPFHVHCLF